MTNDPAKASYMYYDMDGKPIMDTLEWTKLFESEDRLLAQEYTKNKTYWISTVWLGIDHSFGWPIDKPNPRPLIFETMIFYRGSKETEYDLDNDMLRYSTKEEALAGHKLMVDKAQRKENRGR